MALKLARFALFVAAVGTTRLRIAGRRPATGLFRRTVSAGAVFVWPWVHLDSPGESGAGGWSGLLESAAPIRPFITSSGSYGFLVRPHTRCTPCGEGQEPAQGQHDTVALACSGQPQVLPGHPGDCLGPDNHRPLVGVEGPGGGQVR